MIAQPEMTKHLKNSRKKTNKYLGICIKTEHNACSYYRTVKVKTLNILSKYVDVEKRISKF